MRYLAPQNYAITAPPAAERAFRPMTQWEPMRALMLSLDAYSLQDSALADTFTGIALAAAEGGEVWVFAGSEQVKTTLQSGLLDAGMSQQTLADAVKFKLERVDSIWFVDSSPLPIIDEADGTFAFADFRYYHDRPLDDGLGTILGAACQTSATTPRRPSTGRR